jgi:hypothetical protein
MTQPSPAPVALSRAILPSALRRCSVSSCAADTRKDVDRLAREEITLRITTSIERTNRSCQRMPSLASKRQSAGRYRREDLFHLRAPYRPDQARQGAHAGRVRPQSAEGLITQYEVLKGNPPDEVHVASSLRRHRQAFGRAPELYGSDRGFFSEQNLASCKHAGVKLVCIPQRGGKRTPRRQAYESSAAFKNGQRFRAGIEGRISVLFRGRGMKRCLAEGRERFELWVGAAVLANNLMRIAALLTARSPRRRRAA